MNQTDAIIARDSEIDHILLDYPITNEETIPKRYSFFYTLGSGAYATVKYGTCKKTTDPYAIKIISKLKTPKAYLQKFVPREIDALKRLSVHYHPFVSQMREFFETTDKVYLITQLAKGGDLLNYINSRKYLVEDKARKFIAQILCALDHIHDLGIVHRDLKCENLLISADDNIMISDFGFATQQPKNRMLTTFCGSYAYAAPEILTGSSYNGKSTDVWSVGVILYAMLNGRLPFNDTKPKNILVKIKTNPLVMIRQVSNACERYVKSMLTINSMERPDVAELLMKRWLEPPLRKILKTIPENIQPACFKLCLAYRSSFRMSDTSEECMKTFSPRQTQSPATSTTRAPTPIKIAHEITMSGTTSPGTSVFSNNTSSTISERVKRKYRKLKTDLRTWASKKHSTAVGDVQFRNLDRLAQKTVATSSPTPNTGSASGTGDSTRRNSLSSSKAKESNSVKYAVREKSATLKKVSLLEIQTKNDERSASAVPNQIRRKSVESRAKSCKPPADRRVSGDVKKARRESLDSNNNNDYDNVLFKYHTKNDKERINCGTTDGTTTTTAKKKSSIILVSDGRVNDRIKEYLNTQRDRKNQGKSPMKDADDGHGHFQSMRAGTMSIKPGLPPLKMKLKRAGGSDEIERNKRKANALKENKEMEKKRRATYDKATLYHNIQALSNNIAGPTPTKIVSVTPKTRRSSYQSRRSSVESRRGSVDKNPTQSRRGSIDKNALVGFQNLSTVHN